MKAKKLNLTSNNHQSNRVHINGTFRHGMKNIKSEAIFQLFFEHFQVENTFSKTQRRCHVDTFT